MTDNLKNPELEKAALGAVLIDERALAEVATILEPSDFYDLRHAAIYRAALDLWKRGVILDALTICAALKQDEDGVDPTYILELINATPTSLNALEYARHVKRLANRRRKRADGLQLANEANDLSVPDLDGEMPVRARYEVHNALDALTPRPPVEWIVNGLIYKKSVTVIYGDGGTKKTWSAMHLAACVACGAPWGDFATQKSRVLFIDEENGDDEIAGRAGYCIRGALGDAGAELFYISLAAFHLDDPADELLMTKEIANLKVELVILDALADLTTGDENSKQDTQPVFNALRRIAEKTGAAILVIHHANKNGGHRGSSVIKDAPDILLQVTSDNDSDLITFKTEKNRRGKAMQFAMRATWEMDSFYLTGAEACQKKKGLNKAQEYVLRYLKENGPSALINIINAADTCSPEAARKAVYNLARLQLIQRTNPGLSGQGVTAIYELTKNCEG